jgi:hypothetical protein
MDTCETAPVKFQNVAERACPLPTVPGSRAAALARAGKANVWLIFYPLEVLKLLEVLNLKQRLKRPARRNLAAE